MSQFIDSCFEQMNQGEVIVAYKGEINAEVIADTLSLIEDKLVGTDIKNSIKKRLYNVLVEGLQNLYHHVDMPKELIKADWNSNFGIFTISYTEDGFRISTGNFVKNDKTPKIQEKIDNINSLSSEELKEFYKFVLNNQKFSKKGGGGLGLIDIARKTRNKLEYNFIKYNSEYDFFNFTTNINTEVTTSKT
ncbi:MAG: SiaB family protein kinase [Bacteroidales bacterium]|jgi:hypothetical protein|nr:SiaB family protein kinase [Bacteroidales bacterium]MDD4672680.1 SiaB family protein kinase [Bacteroidales bacterium]MDY0347891.1 SiaB family protein kinase [Tenuifilaceae bacterium]